jgi:aldehyde dehydrogenase (NAD+)
MQEKTARTNILALQKFLIHEQDAILQALSADLGKPPMEAFNSEIALLLGEVEAVLKHVKRWSKPQKIKRNWVSMFTRAGVVRAPRGRVLIISPWNYPIYLCLSPLLYALAGGNKVTIKPSEYSPATSFLLADKLPNYFSEGIIDVYPGNAAVSRDLLTHTWDLVFFTGSPETGRKVYAQAAATMSPCVLELGGCNPVIFASHANYKTLLKRLLWGKFFNAGQTCIAPNIALFPIAYKEQIIKELQSIMQQFWPENSSGPGDFALMVNETHLERVQGVQQKLLDSGAKVVYSWEQSIRGRQLGPSIFEVQASHQALLTSHEIFGPLLPVYFYTSQEDALHMVKSEQTPLVLYLMGGDATWQQKWIQSIPASSVCINEVLGRMGFTTAPFGGEGSSGFGSNRGESGFQTFTHARVTVQKHERWGMPGVFPPYRKLTDSLKKILPRFYR